MQQLNNNLKEASEITEAFCDDKLGRKDIAQNLAKVILNTENTYVFSINAPWGMGKSYFINNLIKLLEEDAVCIKYNAWEHDFYENPLAPIVLEIKNILIEHKTEIGRDYDKVCDFISSFDIGFSSFVEVSKKERDIDKYIDMKESIRKLRNNFELIQQKIGKPILIFIDELDRCRPDYAIKTLEIIKHFFEIDNVKFVLAIDKEQVQSSVECLFGTRAEKTADYLRKFIDLEYTLPEPNLKDFTKCLLDDYHIDQIFKIFMDANMYLKNNSKTKKIENFPTPIEDMINHYVEVFHLSLRDVQKLIFKFYLILKTFDVKKTYLFIDVLVPLIFINKVNISFYKEIENNYKKGILRDERFYSENLGSSEYNICYGGFKLFDFLNQQHIFINPKSIDEKNSANQALQRLGLDYDVHNAYNFLAYFDKIDFMQDFVE